MSDILSHLRINTHDGSLAWIVIDSIDIHTGDTSRTVREIVNTDITITPRSKEKHCLWWRDLQTKDHWPCPTQQRIAPWTQLCDACDRRTWFSPFFYNQETISPAQQAYNATPHYVYLAYMWGTDVKIGITWARRWEARLYEQGALYRQIIATCPNAETARHIEHIWASYAWCKEHVRISTKIAALTHSLRPLDTARHLIETKYHLIVDIYTQDWVEASSLETHPIRTHDQYTRYGSDLPWAMTLPKNSPLSWHIVGCIWSSILLTQGKHLCIYNSKSLIWKQIKIEDTAQKEYWHIRQDSLF